MASSISDPRIEYRLRSPNIPLVIKAKDFTPEMDEASSVFTGDDSQANSPERTKTAGRNDSPTPTINLATLLEQEHKINRLQAAKLKDADDTIVKLKREAETNQTSAQSSPRCKHHRNTTSHEIVRLVAEVNDLSESLSETRNGLDIKDRQILELERQLHDMSGRLHTALQSLKIAHEDESYLAPEHNVDPLTTAVHAFKKMSMIELAEANMALSHYLTKSRAGFSPSVPQFASFTNPRTSPKRPGSPFPDLRPKSGYAGLKKKESASSAGAEDQGLLSTPTSRVSQGFASEEMPDSPRKPSAKKSVRYRSGVPDLEQGSKKAKGLFGMGGFFSRK